MSGSKLRRAIKTAGLSLLLLLLLIQVFPPEPPGATLARNGVISDHLFVPAHVDSLLRRSCYDCHSDETRWPWYARLAPVSWLLARDVQHGRSDLDFSSWSMDPVREPTVSQRLRWTCEELQEEEMPPRPYLVAHPEARLSEQEKDAVCAWANAALRDLD